VAAISNPVEHCEAIVVAGNRLAVDDARLRAQVSQRLDHQAEAVGQVVPWAAVEPHPQAFLAGDDAEPIMLDLVQRRQLGKASGNQKAVWS
jgi:hypothetical protein